MNIEKLSIKQIKDLMVKECNDELLTAIKNDARKGVQSIYKSYQREMKRNVSEWLIYILLKMDVELMVIN